MPSYVLTSPEGKKYRVTGDGTGEEALSALQAQLGSSSATKAPEPKQDAFSTVTDQALSGLTFGLGNRAQAGLAALALTGMNDKSLGENYKLAREAKTKQMEQQVEDNPALAIGANIAGGLALGGIGAGTKPIAALGNSLRGGAILGRELGVAGRIAKGSAAGAATGAAYGAGTAGYDKSLEGAGEGAISGAVVGGAIPAVGGAIGRALQKKPNVLSADEIRSLAGQSYKEAEQSGGVLKGWFTNQFLDKVEKLKPQTEAGKLLAGDDAFTKTTERLGSLKNRRLTLQEAQEIDEFLGDAVDGFTEMGRVTKQGKKLLDVQTTLRNMIDDADQSLIEGGKDGFDALKKGRFLWSQSARMRDIEKIINRADMTDNPATAIKTGFRTLYNNPQRMRGFSEEEKKLIKDAAESGIVTDTLRTFGSRLIPIGSTLAGGGLGQTAAAQAATMASRAGAAKAQLGKAQNVARSISQNVQNYGKPAQQIIQRPSNAPLLSAPAGAFVGSGIQSEVAPPAYVPSRPVEIKRIEQQPMSYNADFFDSVKQAESSGNPNAKATTSSASGLYQFTDQTWKDSVAKWGKKYGITEGMKNNPQAQEAMVRELAADNARILTNKLNREPNVADMYVAHVFGADQGAKLINNIGTNRPAFMIMPPRVVNANKTIFFDGRKPRTVEQVYSLLGNKVT